MEKQTEKQAIKISRSGRVALTPGLLGAIYEKAMGCAVDPEHTTLWRGAYTNLALAADHLRLMQERQECTEV